jgi:WXG100 family type VII secretion target
MTIVDCSIQDILDIAKELRQADGGIQAVVRGLDIAIREKEGKWAGNSQQNFMRFFREWRRGMDAQSSALRKVIEQLQKMSEEYRRVIE